MEIKMETDLPPFLLKRTLENWRLRNQSNLEAREKRRQQLLIIDPNLEGEDAGNMGFVYKFQTSESKFWKIFIDKQKPTLNQIAALLPEILFAEFELRQQLSNPRNHNEVKRQQGQDLLAANWNNIVRIFYSNPDAIESEKHLPVFTNVRLNENKILDLVAFGPDGRIFVFYFGSRDENLPQDVKSLLMALRLPFSSLLTIFNGLTSFTNKENNLILTIDESS